MISLSTIVCAIKQITGLVKYTKHKADSEMYFNKKKKSVTLLKTIDKKGAVEVYNTLINKKPKI